MKHLRLGLTALLILAVHAPLTGAAAQDLELSPESRIWIEGTSTRSDWTVVAKEISASASSVDTVVPEALEVTVVASEIKSDNSTIMDRLMHEALKVEEHPTITFQLDEATAGSETRLSTKGRLTLAGVTNEIEMDVEGERLENGGIRYTGSTPLKMTDYGMQPPVAMFGALRTGDDITVHFDVTFVPAG